MAKAFVQVKRMVAMIDGFLNISRLESGKILIEKIHFNIDKLIKEIVDETRITVVNHTFVIDSREDIIVFADFDKINSVISNLVGNAIKYSLDHTNVSIKCDSVNDGVLVSVKDEGFGIDLKDANKIFDRYYRVESNKTKYISGFGIGLYLSADIIKRHGGKIWVESEKDKGSTFYFSLPK